jgi:hypothetical protein
MPSIYRIGAGAGGRLEVAARNATWRSRGNATQRQTAADAIVIAGCFHVM